MKKQIKEIIEKELNKLSKIVDADDINESIRIIKHRGADYLAENVDATKAQRKKLVKEDLEEFVLLLLESDMQYDDNAIELVFAMLTRNEKARDAVISEFTETYADALKYYVETGEWA